MDSFIEKTVQKIRKEAPRRFVDLRTCCDIYLKGKLVSQLCLLTSSKKENCFLNRLYGGKGEQLVYFNPP